MLVNEPIGLSVRLGSIASSSVSEMKLHLIGFPLILLNGTSACIGPSLCGHWKQELKIWN